MKDSFDEIDAMCDSLPHKTISMLDSIDPRSLSEKDRHRYDLLCIKSRDKAYVCHTSDSLILDVIDYYESHQDQGLYPEALYYGGRVFSDIGDLPTALEYFQKSIDATPDDEEYLRLKSSVLSQTGRLLESLRLHQQSYPYIAKAIEISTQLKDSVNIFYDAMLLANIYKHSKEYNMARKQLYVAKKFAPNMPIEDKKWWEIEYASILQHEGKNDSSLMIINRLPLMTDSLYKNYAIGVTADIYKTTGKIDSAYYYAKQLALSSDFTNRFAGFKILFSPEVSLSIPKDSIVFFARSYGDHIDEYLDRFNSEESILQNSKYNYFLHQRERDKAEKEKSQAEKSRNRAIVFGGIAIILLIILISYILISKLKDEIKLRMAIQLLQTLEVRDLQGHNDPPKIEDYDLSKDYDIEYDKKQRYLLPFYSQQENLRKELLARLHFVSRNDESTSKNDERIFQSQVVKRLYRMLSEDKGIKDGETKIWKDIENEVHHLSPEFKSRLYILSKGKMNEKEYRVALLIRCGFKPKEISNLLLRGKSAATDRRRSLSRKIFGDSAELSSLDSLILRV
ncbi:MAG: hypothetical protein K2I08_11140 [Muribaculaceae bacterium]|nr:hypothetical protein [Muribaculaceae bacterium]